MSEACFYGVRLFIILKNKRIRGRVSILQRPLHAWFLVELEGNPGIIIDEILYFTFLVVFALLQIQNLGNDVVAVLQTLVYSNESFLATHGIDLLHSLGTESLSALGETWEEYRVHL